MRNYVRSLVASALMLTVLALLSACGGSATAPTSGAQGGATAPLTDGSAGNGGMVTIGGENTGSGTPSAGQDADTVQGQVVQVDGQKLVIKSESGSSVTVQLRDSTVVQNHELGAIADIKEGAEISVIALNINDTLQAIDIQIGGGPQVLPGAAPVPLAGNEPVPMGGNSAAPAGMPQPESLHGTVEKVDSASLTIKMADGASTTVSLGGQVIIQKISQVSAAEIKTGTGVIAVGKRSGSSFEVTQLNLMNVQLH